MEIAILTIELSTLSCFPHTLSSLPSLFFLFFNHPKIFLTWNSKEKGKKERGSKGRRKWNKGARTMAEKKRREI